jgi:5-methylcytosine-specific restriction protein A
MKSPCKHPGCATLVNGNAYCDKHKRPENEMVKIYRQRYDATRKYDPASLFRSSRKWQNVRRVKLSMNPICEDPCGDHARRGVTSTAKQVHHIVGLMECANDSRAYDLSNLMSVCWKCHAKIEAEVRRDIANKKR